MVVWHRTLGKPFAHVFSLSFLTPRSLKSFREEFLGWTGKWRQFQENISFLLEGFSTRFVSWRALSKGEAQCDCNLGTLGPQGSVSWLVAQLVTRWVQNLQLQLDIFLVIT